MNKKIETGLLKEINKFSEAFIRLKEEDALDEIIELKNEYKDILDAFERVDRKISNYIQEKANFKREIGIIEDYHPELHCLLPFLTSNDLHSININNVMRLLLENKTFTKHQISNVLGQNKEKAEKLMKIILEEFKVEKEITIKCNNCGDELRSKKFFIPYTKKVTKDLMPDIKHTCFKCSLTYEEQREKCSKWAKGICSPDHDCEFNIYKDNQWSEGDIILKESGELRLDL